MSEAAGTALNVTMQTQLLPPLLEHLPLHTRLLAQARPVGSGGGGGAQAQPGLFVFLAAEQLLLIQAFST